MNSSTSEQEDAPLYTIAESEQVEADRERIFLRLNGYGPVYSAQWIEAINKEISSLCEFPGPLANAVDEIATAHFRCEVRSLLIKGPRRRRSGAAYHVLYTVLPPDAENVSIIRILRILHAARGAAEETPEPGADA